MPHVGYDPGSAESIELFGKRLEGSSLRKTPGEVAIPSTNLEAVPGVRHKGDFGMLVERYYYGIEPGNDSCTPDFKDARVELKTNSLVRTAKGLSSKERLVLEMITYSEIVHETFETSCFLQKSRLMMLVSNMYAKDKSIVDAKVAFAGLIDFERLLATDQAIIRNDWEIIVAKVRSGEAHLLSGSDTTFLEACTKGADGTQRVIQPFATEKARPRALALKAGYVTALVRRLMGEEGTVAVSDAAKISVQGFEATILERFDRFLGMDVSSIQSIVESEQKMELSRDAKSYFASLARGMMGVSTRSVAEFDQAGISMKTMTLYNNGSPREHMAFPAFRYMGPDSIAEEIWDAGDDDQASRFKTLLEETRFLFVAYRNDSGVVTLDRAWFWSMPREDVAKYVQPAWEATRTAIAEGDMSRLPGQTFNHVCHVRPHARNKLDTLPTPRNGPQVKRSFWLDKSYLVSQMN